MTDVTAIDSGVALERALRAMEQGAFDGRSMEGARTNALEAIAWALVGLLGDRVRDAASGSVQESLSDALEGAGVTAFKARP